MGAVRSQRYPNTSRWEIHYKKLMVLRAFECGGLGGHRQLL